MKGKILLLSIIVLLFSNCPSKGTIFVTVYNNTTEDITIIVKRYSFNEYTYKVKKQSSYSFSCHANNKKILPSTIIEFVKIINADGIVIKYLEGKSLDDALKFENESEFFIDYKLDIDF